MKLMKRKPRRNVDFIYGKFKYFSGIQPSKHGTGSYMTAYFDTPLGEFGTYIYDDMDNIQDWAQDFYPDYTSTYKLAVATKQGSRIKRSDGAWCGHGDYVPAVVKVV